MTHDTALTPNSPAVESRTTRRLGWMDSLRGAAILVVMLHHAMGLSMRHLPDVPPLAGAVDAALLPLRMPTLVFLSGLLLHASLRKGTRRYASGKWRNLVHPYVVWTVLYVVLLDRQWFADGTGGLRTVARDLVAAPSPLWFLLFLALFYLVGHLVRACGAHPGLVAVGSLVISMGLQDDTRPSRFFYLLAFFLLGDLAGRNPRGFRALLRRPVVLAVSAVLAVLLLTAAVVTRAVDRYDAEYAVAVLAGIVLLVRAAQAVGEQRWTTPLAALGRRSLVPYVVHYPAMVVVAAGLARWAGLERTSIVSAATFAAGLAASVVVLWLQPRVRAVAWLFALPPRRAPRTG